MDLTKMSLVELRELEVAIKAAKIARAEIEKKLTVDAKTARELEFKGKVFADEVITFTYNKKVATGKIIRISDKSVTVESSDFMNKKGSGYVSYDRIISVVRDEVKVAS